MSDINALADAILALINSVPRTPTREEIVGLLDQYRHELSVHTTVLDGAVAINGVQAARIIGDDARAILAEQEQKEEFERLKQEFRDDPEALWRAYIRSKV